MATYKRILAVAIAVFFVVSFASIAVAKEQLYSLRGEVVSVDPAAKTLTVKAINTDISSPVRTKGEAKIATDEMTKIKLGKKDETFEGIKAGEKVSVRYHEKDGKYVADRILISSEHAAMK